MDSDLNLSLTRVHLSHPFCKGGFIELFAKGWRSLGASSTQEPQRNVRGNASHTAGPTKTATGKGGIS